MKVLIDVGHPAHVHLFKNFIKYLGNNSHEVFVTSREKDITTDLLNHYKIQHTIISKARKGILGMIWELLIRDIRTIKLHLKHKFDVSFGTSVNIAHLTAIFGVPSYVFSEDDDDIIPLFAYSTYPFATRIIIPETLKYKKWKGKRIKHNSSHKLAYLHPNNFKPNPKVLTKYNLKKDEFLIIRKSALTAHHDKNAGGINSSLLEKLLPILNNYKIIDSKEGINNKNIDFYDMHDLLYYAKLIICDSQSMSVEAAMLGTPCMRVSTFTKRISILEELENKYEAVYSFYPNQKQQIIKRVNELVSNKNLRETFQKRKEKILTEKQDFNKWMINYFQSNLEYKK